MIFQKKHFLIFALLFESLASCLAAQDIDLGSVYTYLDKPVAEQRLVITSQQIKDSHKEDLCSLLQEKGIQILSYGPYGLESKPSIRGFTDETVRVVIDGICVNNAQYGTFDFSSINLNQIERIEIVKGGFTEGLGDEGAVGGVVYITTKKQDVEKEFSSDTSLKSYAQLAFPIDSAYQKINFSSPVGENSFFKMSLSASAAKNEFYFRNRKNEFEIRKDSSVWDSNASVAFTHFYGKGSSFTFGDSIYAANKMCPGPETSIAHGIQKDYDNSLSLSIVNPAIANSLRLESNFAWFKNFRFYDEGEEHSVHDIDTFKASSAFTCFASDFFTQSGGASFEGVFLDSSNDGKHTQFSFAAKSNSKIFVNQWLSFTVPLTFKIQGENSAFVPKLGAKLDFDFGQFVLTAYRMVQFPNMDDLYWIGSDSQGNENLLPEEGWGGELTFNSKLRQLPFSICIFTNYYENKIQWQQTDGIYMPQNLASAFYLGFDLDASRKFFDDRLKISFSAEYLYTRLLDESNPLTYGKRIMWTPDFVASLSANLTLDKWLLEADASYVGKRYKSNLNALFLKPYVLANASASYVGFEIAKPYIVLENILFQDYEAVDSYPMPIFSMTFGVSVNCKW